MAQNEQDWDEDDHTYLHDVRRLLLRRRHIRPELSPERLGLADTLDDERVQDDDDEVRDQLDHDEVGPEYVVVDVQVVRSEAGAAKNVVLADDVELWMMIYISTVCPNVNTVSDSYPITSV